MKRVVFFLLGLVVLVLAAALALPFVIDPNQFRPMLETRLTQALGREVKLGNLKLSILAGTVEAEDLSIAEDPAFGKTPFLKAHSLGIQVELMPLIFSRKLNVGGIVFDQPEITLIQSVKGTWNASTLGASGPSKTAEPAAASSSKLDLVVHEVKITNGKLTLLEEGQGAALPRVFDQVNMDITGFSPASQFPFKMSAHLSGGGMITLDGKAGPIPEKDAALTPAQLHYKLTDGDLAASHFLDPSTGIRGLVGAEGDVNWTGAAFDAKGTIRGDKLVLAKGGSPAQRDLELDFDVHQDVVQHTGQIKSGVVHLGKAIANLNGNYSLKDPIIAVGLQLNGTNMPMDELVSFLPALDIALPAGSSIKGGTISLKMTSAGHLDNLATEGSVDIEGTSLQNFDLGGKMRIVESLAGLKGGANTDFQKVAASMSRNNLGTSLSNIQVIAPSIGDLTGGGTISAQKALALKMKVNLHGSAGGLTTAALGSSEIPFFVEGTVSNPQIKPDVGAVAKGAVKDIINKEAGKSAVGGILGGFLGGKKKPDSK
jgi:AsmA protein